jgi:hypothetical protein
MPWAAAAVVGSAAIGYMGATSAAGAQADAADNATAATQAQYQQTRADLRPYMDQGGRALTSLNSFLDDPNNNSFTAQDFTKYQDPSYQWQLGQGQQALQNSQAAQDGVLSGAALKGMQNYTQGMASTNYQSAYTNWYNTTNQNYTRLAGLAQLGEGAAAGSGSIGANLAQTSAGTQMAAGNAQAAGYVGGANAITGSVNNGLGYYQLNKLLSPTPNNSSADGNAAWTGTA